MVKTAIIFILFIALVIILVIIYFYLCSNNIKILDLTGDKILLDQYHLKIDKFEKSLRNWYPIGDDFFCIDHGVPKGRYYNFFERLGKMSAIICTNNQDTVVGTCFGILRDVPLTIKDPNKNTKVWYICDLKIDPKFRGNHIPFKMLLKCVPKALQSRKVYGISMDSTTSKNHICKLTNKFPFLKFKYGGKLVIYRVGYHTLQKIVPLIVKFRGPIRYTSLRGCKDLILKRSNQPMKLLHLQWAHLSKPDRYTVFDLKTLEDYKLYEYMFCVPLRDPLISELLKLGVFSDITATVVHRGMDRCDWKFVMTSDI